MNYLLVIICSVFSAVLYRAGGMSKTTDHWIPKFMRRSWVRDWLIPLCALLPIFINHPSWWFFLAYGALGGALSTYWDWLFKFDNFWFSGFMCGVAGFPLLFCGFSFWQFLIRALVIGVAWGGWCGIFSNDFVEEYGRGFSVAFASFIFLLPS